MNEEGERGEGQGRTEGAKEGGTEVGQGERKGEEKGWPVCSHVLADPTKCCPPGV